MPLPTVNFDPSKTLLPQKTFIKITPEGGTAVSLITNDFTYDPSFESAKREVVGSDGLIRPDRIEPTKHMESFKAVIEDIKSVPAIFGGNSMSGIKRATAEVWITDPQDAAGKACFHIAPFKCLVSTDGSVSMKGTEFSKASIKIEATEKTLWDVDYTLPV